jgi:hypothetical protein
MKIVLFLAVISVFIVLNSKDDRPDPRNLIPMDLENRLTKRLVYVGKGGSDLIFLYEGKNYFCFQRQDFINCSKK